MPSAGTPSPPRPSTPTTWSGSPTPTGRSSPGAGSGRWCACGSATSTGTGSPWRRTAAPWPRSAGACWWSPRDVTDQAAKDAAEQANEAKSEYMSRMSHELRTPLNAILGFAQLLELDELHDEQRDNLGHIMSGARHLLSLINEVLDIAAIEAGRLTLSLEPVPLADVVAETVSLIRPLADQHNIMVAAPDVACSTHVLGDRQRLKQVLLNLLSNAVKYNREGGSVEFSCAAVADDRLRIKVTDTGSASRPR